MIDCAKIIGILVASILFTGCATQATLSIYSQPEGAYITEVETGKSFGMAPVAVVYDPASLNLHKNAEGCFMVKGFEARWVSGAASTINPIKLCGSNIGDYNIILNRDSSHPNLEKDLQFAIQLQALRAQQQQAQAAKGSAAAALWSAWSASQQNNINCTTTPIGSSVYTNCR